MSDSWKSSDYSSSLPTNSESSPNTPCADRSDFHGYFEDGSPIFDRSHSTANVGPPYDGTINPQMLDNRLGKYPQPSIDTVGHWIEAGVSSGTINSSVYDGFSAAAAEEALQLVQDRRSAQIDDLPWAPSQRYPEHASQRPVGSMATRSTAAPSKGGLCLPNTLTSESRVAAEVDVVSAPGLTTTEPAGPEMYREKVPIERSKSSSTTSESSSSSFTCEECGKVIGRDGDLKRHNIDQHDASQIFYRCDKCGWDDRRLDKVKGHCRERHVQQTGLERYSEEFGQPSRIKRPRGPNKKLRGPKA